MRPTTSIDRSPSASGPAGTERPDADASAHSSADRAAAAANGAAADSADVSPGAGIRLVLVAGRTRAVARSRARAIAERMARRDPAARVQLRTAGPASRLGPAGPPNLEVVDDADVRTADARRGDHLATVRAIAGRAVLADAAGLAPLLEGPLAAGGDELVRLDALARTLDADDPADVPHRCVVAVGDDRDLDRLLDGLARLEAWHDALETFLAAHRVPADLVGGLTGEDVLDRFVECGRGRLARLAERLADTRRTRIVRDAPRVPDAARAALEHLRTTTVDALRRGIERAAPDADLRGDLERDLVAIDRLLAALPAGAGDAIVAGGAPGTRAAPAPVLRRRTAAAAAGLARLVREIEGHGAPSFAVARLERIASDHAPAAAIPRAA